MAKERILLVDDEPNVLSGYRRNLRTQFDVTVALSGQEGIDLVETSEPFSVIVSDMRMPEMNGVDFLKRIKSISPDSVRMMLTGNADQETAMQAVNHGHIFRFLTKPCTPQNLTIALTMGIRQYRLIVAERDLLEKTLKGSVELLTEILSLTDPSAFSVSSRVKSYLNAVQEELGLVDTWGLEVAALLSPIGFLTMPPELKAKVTEGLPLSGKEDAAVRSVPEIGGRLLAHIPRLEGVAALVRTGVDTSTYAGDLDEKQQDGLRAIRLLFDLVKKEQVGMPTEQAIALILKQGRHEASLVEATRDALQRARPELFSGQYIDLDVNLKKVMIGDELSENVTSEDDRLLLAAGSRITGPFLERLVNYRKLVGIKEPIKVRRFIPKGTPSIPPEEQ